MNHIAIIPARGGSKRLPNKNIKLFSGKPLIKWTIDAAIETKKFDLVIVTSDSDEILKIANYGNVVLHKRPVNLSTDIATTEDVVADVIRTVEADGVEVETFTILQPTSPLRNAEHIIAAHKIFNDRKDIDALVSVSKCSFPLEFVNSLQDGLSMSNFLDSQTIKRTQDLTEAYRLNGAIIISNRCLNNSFNDFYSNRSAAYIMSDLSGIDIDTLEDFKLAECILENLVS